MKAQLFTLLGAMAILFISCKQEEMKIDSHLLTNSTRFEVDYNMDHPDGTIQFGHFSSYDKQMGLAWMETTGINQYFDANSLYTFSCDNNDNYTYDIVASPIKEKEKIVKYAENFNMPVKEFDSFKSAFAAYLYAPHDEYSMVFLRINDDEHIGYLSNGFEQYEIIPVYTDPSAATEKKIEGYQIKLNGEYVGSLQQGEEAIYRMTTEYCDATEIIIASIASTLIKCEKI